MQSQAASCLLAARPTLPLTLLDLPIKLWINMPYNIAQTRLCRTDPCLRHQHGYTGAVRQLTTRVTYVLPVSDDGGSTAEIVRVLGGPAVGDIRSRCLRLADDSDEEASAGDLLIVHYRLTFYGAHWTVCLKGTCVVDMTLPALCSLKPWAGVKIPAVVVQARAVKKLLAHRLNSHSSAAAKAEWYASWTAAFFPAEIVCMPPYRC